MLDDSGFGVELEDIMSRNRAHWYNVGYDVGYDAAMAKMRPLYDAARKEQLNLQLTLHTLKQRLVSSFSSIGESLTMELFRAPTKVNRQAQHCLSLLSVLFRSCRPARPNETQIRARLANRLQSKLRLRTQLSWPKRCLVRFCATSPRVWNLTKLLCRRFHPS